MESAERISVLESDVAKIRGDVAVLKADVTVLKADVAVLKSDVSILKTGGAVLKNDVSVLKEDVAVARFTNGAKSDLAMAFDNLRTEMHKELNYTTWKVIGAMTFLAGAVAYLTTHAG